VAGFPWDTLLTWAPGQTCRGGSWSNIVGRQ
jgi:hypothetical protein